MLVKLTSEVNFTNILRAVFLLITFHQMKTKPKLKLQKKTSHITSVQYGSEDVGEINTCSQFYQQFKSKPQI
jgi:hypothetical protein